MRTWQYYISLALALACVVLTIFLVIRLRANQGVQMALQAQQEAINKGTLSQQVGQNIVKDLAQISLENTEVKDLLSKHGFTVNVNPSPTP